MPSDDILIEILKILPELLWTLLAVGVVLFLAPTLKAVLAKRNVSLKFGTDRELTIREFAREVEDRVEGMADQSGSSLERIMLDLEGLKSRVAALEPPTPVGGAAGVTAGDGVAPGEKADMHVGRILWVDDQPRNNAILASVFRGQGWSVEEAVSTGQALAMVGAGYDLIISDIGRTENGRYNPRAGTEFLAELRKAGMTVPTIFFTAPQALDLAFLQSALRAFPPAQATASTRALMRLVEEIREDLT
ncbi:response regulator [Fluviibacterium sp. DFM31]|uniref:Response regulator n=1 Tax=Meridianimarinicoccus marinus TaxID=3231483 RepID=A0ABV3L4S4_9RHOB